MIEKIGTIKNPLTIIAIFAAIAEISGTIVLPFVTPANQGNFVWFLMLFPILLVTLFFLTLNFNHKVLYAPSDFKDETNFMKQFAAMSAAEKAKKIGEETKNIQLKSFPPCLPPGSESFKSRSITLEDDLRRGTYLIAEALVMKKLSSELCSEIKTDMKFKLAGDINVSFDGVAFIADRVHAIEVKFFSDDNFHNQSIETILSTSKLVADKIASTDNKQLRLVLAIVSDADEAVFTKIERKMKNLIESHKVLVDLRMYTLESLKKEFEVSSNN